MGVSIETKSGAKSERKRPHGFRELQRQRLPVVLKSPKDTSLYSKKDAEDKILSYIENNPFHDLVKEREDSVENAIVIQTLLKYEAFIQAENLTQTKFEFLRTTIMGILYLYELLKEPIPVEKRVSERDQHRLLTTYSNQNETLSSVILFELPELVQCSVESLFVIYERLLEKYNHHISVAEQVFYYEEWEKKYYQEAGEKLTQVGELLLSQHDVFRQQAMEMSFTTLVGLVKRMVCELFILSAYFEGVSAIKPENMSKEDEKRVALLLQNTQELSVVIDNVANELLKVLEYLRDEYMAPEQLNKLSDMYNENLDALIDKVPEKFQDSFASVNESLWGSMSQVWMRKSLEMRYLTV